MNQPLWLNNYLNSPKFFIKDWYNKGIWSLKHICQGNRFIPFEILKERYNIKGTFLHYVQLISNIPQAWKTAIKKQFDVDLYFDMYILPCYQDLLICKKGSRLFYDKLIFSDLQPKICKKWEIEFGECLEWIKFFVSFRKDIRDVKSIDFQFRFLHRIIMELFWVNNTFQMTCWFSWGISQQRARVTGD